MSKVETRFRALMLVSVIIAVLEVAVGVLLTTYLDFSVKLAAVIIGTVILLYGMFYLIRYLYDGLGKKVFAIDLIIAVVNIIIGAFTIFYDFSSINHLGIMFAIHLVSAAVEKGYFGLKLKKIADPAYPLVCTIAILMIVMGVIVSFNPFKEFLLTTKLIGAFMFGAGFFEGMICKLFFSKTETLLKMF